MLRCEKCGVEIACKTDVCPLCHERLDTDAERIAEIKRLERAFPKRPSHRAHVNGYFGLVYLLLFISITITCAVTNYFLTPNTPWAIIAVGSMIYLYVCIRGTLLTSKAFHARVLGQAVALALIFVLAQRIFGKNLWIYEFVLPTICFTSTVIMAVYVAAHLANARRFTFTLFFMALFGMLPLIIVLSIKAQYVIPSIVQAAISGVILIATAVFGRKQLVSDVRRFIHQ